MLERPFITSNQFSNANAIFPLPHRLKSMQYARWCKWRLFVAGIDPRVVETIFSGMSIFAALAAIFWGWSALVNLPVIGSAYGDTQSSRALMYLKEK